MNHIRKGSMVRWIGLALAGALFLFAAGGPMGQETARAQGTIYVDADASGASDGSSWEDAYTALQPALDEAMAGDEIWVAAGTYKPTHEFDPGDPRSAAFCLKNGVRVYGGFDPTVGDTEWEDRDWGANVTILSGDLGSPDVPTDNSYHVLYHPAGLSLDATAVLDGLSITGGYADASGHLRGGGMYNDGSSPTVVHCTFAGNSAATGGGMANCASSAPTVIDCTFSDNSATQDYGGGMFNDGSSPSIAGCVFAGNQAPEGAGIYSTQSSPTVINSTFTGNSGEKGAGMMNYDNVVAVVTNCTFSGNLASNYAGGIFSGHHYQPSTLIATNCILWGDAGGELFHTQGSTMTVTHSDVQGSLYPGAGNKNVDPRFRDPAAADFHLLSDSPCIDTGANDAPSLPDTDFEGDMRVADGDKDGTAIADMGIDELVFFSVGVSYAGNGSGLVSLDPPGGFYAPGTEVTLTAVAAPGSSFTGWSGDAGGTTNPITLTMDSDKAVTATFALTYRLCLPLVMRAAP